MSARRSDSADVVVIGGGVVGAATARSLARGGTSVALLEQGSLAEAEGSSRGTARIIAPAPYPDAEYLERGMRALAEWRALETASGESLLIPCGALYEGEGIEAFAGEWERVGVEIERLSPAGAQTRFGFTGIDADPLLFQRAAGVLGADRAWRTLLEAAEAEGAQLCEREAALEVAVHDGRCEVRTAERTWECEQAVLVAGPWTKSLAAELGIELALEVSSQSVAYFEPPPGLERMPALMSFDGDEPYALIDPARGLKAALHRRGPEVGPGEWDLVDPEAVDRIAAWAETRFPGLDPRPIRTEACLYTNTADERFLVERRDALLIASACSGQGFGFAPDTGAWLAELVLR